MKYKFNKEYSKIGNIAYVGWYIDLPDFIKAGGSKGSLAMVAGADDFLDILLGDDKSNTVTLDLVLEQQEGYEALHKIPKKKILRYVTGGADYILHTYEGKQIDHKMWLCNVTKYVFGYFPKIIYFKKV